MQYFHFMIDSGRFEGNPLLAVPEMDGTFWSLTGGHNSVRIHREDGNNRSYMAQSTYVYDTEKPIWVTSEGGALNNANQYWDAWSGTVDLPKYFDPDKSDVRTSEELKRVAEAAGTVLSLHNTCKEQHRNTDVALRELEDLAGEHWPAPLHPPKIFIASATSADDEVMGAILWLGKS